MTSLEEWICCWELTPPSHGRFHHLLRGPAPDTAYGWVISGKYHAQQQTPRSHLCLTAGSVDQQTQDLLINFLETERLASTDTSEPTRTQDEQRVEDHFLQTHSRQPDGRYVIQLPQKMDPPALGCSREHALRRHHQNSASLTRKGKFKEFQDALWDYARCDHAERVPQQDLLKPESEGYYLPTHGVFKESSTMTKLRVVFDATASTTSGSSLNEQLLAGPNLYPQLVPILINFRSYVVGMTTDIGKMFHEIALDHCERDVHRFLVTGEDGQTEDWRMKRLTFGVTSSPFLATQLYKDEFPEASDIILHHLHVDDCIAGAATEEDAICIWRQLNDLLQHPCMTLRKWRTNSPALLHTIPGRPRQCSTSPRPRTIRKPLGSTGTPRRTIFTSTPQHPPLLSIPGFLRDSPSLRSPGLVRPLGHSAKDPPSASLEAREDLGQAGPR